MVDHQLAVCPPEHEEQESQGVTEELRGSKIRTDKKKRQEERKRKGFHTYAEINFKKEEVDLKVKKGRSAESENTKCVGGKAGRVEAELRLRWEGCV